VVPVTVVVMVVIISVVHPTVVVMPVTQMMGGCGIGKAQEAQTGDGREENGFQMHIVRGVVFFSEWTAAIPDAGFAA